MDFSWKNPTEEQMRALQTVSKALGVKTPDPKFMALDVTYRHMLADMNESNEYKQIVPPSLFEMAEMMLMAKDSFWYSLASKDTSVGAQRLVEAVNNGFDVKSLWGETTAVNVSLAATYCYVRLLSNALSGNIGSAWFRYVPVFLGLNIDKIKMRGEKSLTAQIYNESLRVYDQKTLRELREKAAALYEPAKCIYPDCDKLVAPRNIKPRDGHVKPYGDSGACCREHTHYECLNPKCVKRAEKEGWKRMTHTFDTKIGKEHLEFRKK